MACQDWWKATRDQLSSRKCVLVWRIQDRFLIAESQFLYIDIIRVQFHIVKKYRKIVVKSDSAADCEKRQYCFSQSGLASL